MHRLLVCIASSCCEPSSTLCSSSMEGARQPLSFSIIKILGTEGAVCSEESSPYTAAINTGSGSPEEDGEPSDCPSCNDLKLDSRGEPGSCTISNTALRVK